MINNTPVLKNISALIEKRKIEAFLKKIKEISGYKFKDFFRELKKEVFFLFKGISNKNITLSGETLISKNKKVLLIIEIDNFSTYALLRDIESGKIMRNRELFLKYRSASTVKIKLFGRKEDISLIINKIRSFKDILLFRLNSPEELGIKRRLGETLKKDTPRFKRLENKELIKILPKFENPEIRTLIKKIRQEMREGPIDSNTMRENLSRKEKNLLPNLLKTKIWDVGYRIACKECNYSEEASSWFKSKQEAEEVIKKAEFKCVICRKKERKVVKCYQLSKNAEFGVLQGFWLEYLVYDYIKKETDDIWFSSYLESMENDVLFLIDEKLVLISCKDTSIKNSELYSLKAIGEEIGADKIIVVCSEKLKGLQIDKALESIEIIKFTNTENLHKKLKTSLIDFKVNIILKALRHEYLGR